MEDYKISLELVAVPHGFGPVFSTAAVVAENDLPIVWILEHNMSVDEFGILGQLAVIVNAEKSN